jgi:hypothetical protein
LVRENGLGQLWWLNVFLFNSKFFNLPMADDYDESDDEDDDDDEESTEPDMKGATYENDEVGDLLPRTDHRLIAL